MIYIKKTSEKQEIHFPLLRTPMPDKDVFLDFRGQVSKVWYDGMLGELPVSAGGQYMTMEIEIADPSVVDDLETGDYNYILYQDILQPPGPDGVIHARPYILSQGVMQYGDFEPDVKQHEETLEIKQYDPAAQTAE